MPVIPPGQRWHEEVDIGVVGAGGCGLVCAHTAARDDLRVVIWEKSKAAGGSTALSGGIVGAAGTRMQHAAGVADSSEEFASDVLGRNHNRSDPALTRRLCESSAALVEWLTDTRGIQMELLAQTTDRGHTRLRLHAPPSRSGQAFIDGLLRSLERRGIRLRLGTPVLQLWSDADGAVVGVQVKIPKKSPTNVRCGKLILATGGFGANRTLLARHCEAAAALDYIGGPTSDGDALTWAEDVGAATRDLGAFEAHATVAVGSRHLVPWVLVTSGAILVNQRGERFGDERGGPAALVTPVLSQPGGVAYEVFDARILKAVTADDPHFASEVVPRAVRRGDDVVGLARQFQIDPDALVHTINAYNETAPEPFAPPFFGIRVSAALLQTQGGLLIDANARVLRSDGTPVPNLYAGGGAAVGCSGPGADGYLLGNGLLCALGWGRIAGEQAALELLAARATPDEPAPQPDGEPGAAVD